jgi:hypothetical protein
VPATADRTKRPFNTSVFRCITADVRDLKSTGRLCDEDLHGVARFESRVPSSHFDFSVGTGNHHRRDEHRSGSHGAALALANAYVERVIGSIRRECLDHVIVLNAAGLHRVLRDYVAYYREHRHAYGED